jgi:Leucine-rich repeat (LRR) protein
VRLNQLENLSLAWTKITDLGLKELAPLQSLTSLDLSGTKVTVAGVKELQKALPKCEIKT